MYVAVILKYFLFVFGFARFQESQLVVVCFCSEGSLSVYLGFEMRFRGLRRGYKVWTDELMIRKGS